ncbi:MAG TPA: (d)CMP kinase [Solirubrobacterales bacterium]|nr:(d)CMP kinase [Solirubrobacterales bacterium]
MRTKLDLRKLLSDLVKADLEFIVIGSSALAIQGWEVLPGDLDILTREDQVDRVRDALGVADDEADWVVDGAARRLECLTPAGPVDIYVEVSNSLTFDEVDREATTVMIGEELIVRAGSLGHVRDMRAAVGRKGLPVGAIPPGEHGERPQVIAIDGPAGAGKSTVTRAVASRIGFTYLDTGAMYRSTALAVLQRRADTDDPQLIAEIARSIDIQFREQKVFLDGSDVTALIRSAPVTEATAHIAAYPEVRTVMVDRQRHLFAKGGYVAEGRDTGTVVAPDAPLKIYLTASAEERARRRSLETGGPVDEVLEAIERRDRLDSERKISALKTAEDAVVIDTTGRSIDDVVDEIVDLARDRGIA